MAQSDRTRRKEEEYNLYKQSSKPGEFTYEKSPAWSGYSKQGDWDKLFSDLQNRGTFDYDVNADALWGQYQDQYERAGKLAMKDTMGQAAALTGGYGNSYAQSVGQQQYNTYMQDLTNKIPELYQLARENYDRQTQDLYNKYGLYQSDYEREYGEYGDNYDRWLNGYSMAYSQHRDSVADYNAALDRLWNEYGTYTGEDQYAENLAEQRRQYNLSLEEEQRQFKEKLDFEREQFEASQEAASGTARMSNSEYNKAVEMLDIYAEEDNATAKMEAYINGLNTDEDSKNALRSMYGLAVKYSLSDGDFAELDKLRGRNKSINSPQFGDGIRRLMEKAEMRSDLEKIREYLAKYGLDLDENGRIIKLV